VNSLNNIKFKDLVSKTQEGDMNAFRGIFDQLNNRLFAYAASHARSREDALDIVQETFIDLWKSLEKFHYRSDEEFYGFVFTIIKRKLARHYRSRTHDIPIDEADKIGVCEMNREDYRYLMKHINNLALQYQDLLKLRYWSQMTFGEIAFVLNIKETTAKVWHYRALQKLKLTLDKNIYDI